MGTNGIAVGKGQIVLDEEARFTYRDGEGRLLHVFNVNGGVVLHMTDDEGQDSAVFVDDDCASFLVRAFERISGFTPVNAGKPA